MLPTVFRPLRNLWATQNWVSISIASAAERDSVVRRPLAYCWAGKDLITAAKYNSDPWEGGICRPMKFGKEEIIGLVTAIDWWSRADLAALDKEWQGRVERIAKLVETVPGVTTSIATPTGF